MKQKCILVITDGIGHNFHKKNNAFFKAKKPNYNYLFKNTHNGLIRTSGAAVGLPAGQMGNSEVGHMILGSGRVIKQDLVRIDESIKNENFENILLDNLKNFDKNANYHILGLYSDGGVHSSFLHFNECVKIAKKHFKNVFAHPICDGRDVLKDSFAEFLQKNIDFFNQLEVPILSVGGRYFAMDRDKNYDRVEKYTKAIFHSLKSNKNHINIQQNNEKAISYIKNQYSKNIFDEMIKPASFGSDFNDNFNNDLDFSNATKQEKNDIFIIINFRNDRVRQLCECLEKISPNIITMTEYDERFSYPILFSKQKPQNTLAEVISKANLTQYHTAETEKYAHVSFFFNSREEPFSGEKRHLVPSPKISYDKYPQMSAHKVCESAILGLKECDFVVVNFANGDMVGHTGDFKSSVRAVEIVDECLGKIIKACKRENAALILCSDHGNCELMKKGNKIIKNHTTFDVFCFIACDLLGGFKRGKIRPNQSLANVAPTVLKIMGLDIPKEMTKPLF